MGKGRKSETHRQTIGKRTGNLKLNPGDYKGIAQGIGITIVIAVLFYKSIFGLLTGVAIIPFWLRLYQSEQLARRKEQIILEFKEYMMLISSGLQAGYSLEKAIRSSEDELKRLFDEKSQLVPFIHIMNQKISMNTQVEKAFEEFATAIELDEALSLAEIISYAKRSGGDYGKHIRNTATKIEEKLAVSQEIATITTAKRLELKVMCVMPMGILGYIAITSGSFIAPLYGNLIGVVLMSICLVFYGILIMIGRKIIEIKV